MTVECLIEEDEHGRVLGVAFDPHQWCAIIGDPCNPDHFDLCRKAWRKIFSDDPRVARAARNIANTYIGRLA